MEREKELVQQFWNMASCGESLYLHGSTEKEAFLAQEKSRYKLEPYILTFADFKKYKDKKVLEIGVGLGADHQKFAEAGAELFGIDLTERAINNTAKRLSIFDLYSNLKTGDAENLDYPDSSFDLVYSWGVIHHSPNTDKAIEEIYRITKEGGEAKIMIYHTYSLVGYMLWLRYGLARLRPFTSLKQIYSKYLESPGTKAYTVNEAKGMFSSFSDVEINCVLTHGDLLESEAGQRHQGSLLRIVKYFFPRKLVKKLLPGHGLFMLIKATK
ncbi:class I SAM-dependent methyltransferase [Aquirufa nivalisilvae]